MSPAEAARCGISFTINPNSPEANAHRALEERWRAEGRLSPVATIRRCEESWRMLVQQIEAGTYDDHDHEWKNDLDARKILQRAIDDLPTEFSAPLTERVHPWDERYMAATVPSRSYWPGGWWSERVPKQLGRQLAHDLNEYLL